MQLYKGRAYVLGRSSETEKLYSAEEASMDTLEVRDSSSPDRLFCDDANEAQNFSPVDTTGFIGIQSIRLKKYGLQKAEEGANLSRAK